MRMPVITPAPSVGATPVATIAADGVHHPDTGKER